MTREPSGQNGNTRIRNMDIDNRLHKDKGERLSAFALACVTTLLVLAAINAGFTAHASNLAGTTQVEASSHSL